MAVRRMGVEPYAKSQADPKQHLAGVRKRLFDTNYTENDSEGCTCDKNIFSDDEDLVSRDSSRRSSTGSSRSSSSSTRKRKSRRKPCPCHMCCPREQTIIIRNPCNMCCPHPTCCTCNDEESEGSEEGQSIDSFDQADKLEAIPADENFDLSHFDDGMPVDQFEKNIDSHLSTSPSEWRSMLRKQNLAELSGPIAASSPHQWVTLSGSTIQYPSQNPAERSIVCPQMQGAGQSVMPSTPNFGRDNTLGSFGNQQGNTICECTAPSEGSPRDNVPVSPRHFTTKRGSFQGNTPCGNGASSGGSPQNNVPVSPRNFVTNRGSYQGNTPCGPMASSGRSPQNNSPVSPRNVEMSRGSARGTPNRNVSMNTSRAQGSANLTPQSLQFSRCDTLGSFGLGGAESNQQSPDTSQMRNDYPAYGMNASQMDCRCPEEADG